MSDGVEKAVNYFENLGSASHIRAHRHTEDTYLPIYQSSPEKLRRVEEIMQVAKIRSETRSGKDFHNNKENGTFAQIAETLPLIANHINVFGEGVRFDISQTAKSEDEAGAFADLAVSLDISEAWKTVAETPGHPLKAYTNELTRLTKYFVIDVTTHATTQKKVEDRAMSLSRSHGTFSDLYFYWRKKDGMQGPPRLAELGIPEAPKLILKSDTSAMLNFLRRVQPCIEIHGNTEAVTNFSKFKEEYAMFFLGTTEAPGAALRLLEDSTLLIQQMLYQYNRDGFLSDEETQKIVTELEQKDPISYHKRLSRLRLSTPDAQKEKTIRKLAELKLSLHFLVEHAQMTGGKKKPLTQ